MRTCFVDPAAPLQPHRSVVLDVHTVDVSLVAPDAGKSLLTGQTREVRVADARLFLLSDLLLICHPTSATFRFVAHSSGGSRPFGGGVEGLTLPGDTELPGAKEGWRYRLVRTVTLADVNLGARATEAPLGPPQSSLPKEPPHAASHTPAGVAAAVVQPVELMWYEHSGGGAEATAVARLSVSCRSDAVREAFLRALSDTVRKAQDTTRDLRRRVAQSGGIVERQWFRHTEGGDVSVAGGATQVGAVPSGSESGSVAQDAIRQLDAIRQRQQGRAAAGARLSVPVPGVSGTLGESGDRSSGIRVSGAVPPVPSASSGPALDSAKQLRPLPPRPSATS